MTTSNSEKKQQFVNPFSENFMPHWEEWKYYKKEQHRFTYKPAGEQAAIKRLVKLSRGDEAIAIQMLEEASGNGWKGFFELKTPINGKVNQGNTQKPTPAGNVAPGGFGQF